MTSIHPTDASFALPVNHDSDIVAYRDADLALEPATALDDSLTPEWLGTLAREGQPKEVTIDGREVLLYAVVVPETDWRLIIALDLAEANVGEQEQSQGVTQVKQAVNDLDQMTQHNASMVEESTVAAEQMRDQAARLAEVVGRFSLREDGHAQTRPALTKS